MSHIEIWKHYYVEIKKETIFGGSMAVLQEGEGAVLVDSLVHVQITLLPQRTYLQHLLQHLLQLLIMKGHLTLRS